MPERSETTQFPVPVGWLAFGSLVDHGGPVEFSEATGADGLPLWERPMPTRPTNACGACADCYHPSFGPNTDGDPCPWCRDCGCHESEHASLGGGGTDD